MESSTITHFFKISNKLCVGTTDRNEKRFRLKWLTLTNFLKYIFPLFITFLLFKLDVSSVYGSKQSFAQLQGQNRKTFEQARGQMDVEAQFKNSMCYMTFSCNLWNKIIPYFQNTQYFK